MQANGRRSHKGKFGKIGSFILGVVIFTAGHAWAVPFTGVGQGSIGLYSSSIYGPDGTFSHFVSH